VIFSWGYYRRYVAKINIHAKVLEMRTIVQIVPYIQLGLSVILIALVLLQQSEADLGSAFGGGESLNAPSHTRRGAERVIFISTIVVAVLFAASSLVAFIVR
jgi:protein translocase SecG subunit